MSLLCFIQMFVTRTDIVLSPPEQRNPPF